jgi:single-strand DNA-binding protein
MAASVNKVILVGNLGKDPEIHTTQEGQKMAALSVATSEIWKDKATGERRERTEWHKVVIFNERLAEFASLYVKKGAKVYIEGQLQTRKLKWLDGVEHNTTEVVLSKYHGELMLLSAIKKENPHVGGESFDAQDDEEFFF